MKNALEKISFYFKTISGYIKTAPNRANTKKQHHLHIVFCTVDHYEPGTGGVDSQTEEKRVDDLLNKYPELACKHTDSAGNIPKRTWFFPPHYHRNYSLKKLVSLCEKGFGEVELHLHHGKTKPDTPENLERTITQCIEEYSKFGIFGTQGGKRKYGFIHGDWALNNSRSNAYCGVNNEIDILIKTGCYADFTFPSMKESNPSQINSVYYAAEGKNEPKSYDRGRHVKKGDEKTGGLMMVQGPVYPYCIDNKLSGLRMFGDVIDGTVPVDSKRINKWVETAIHIDGVPNVIFIKTHTHGATDHKAVLGEEMDMIFSHLESAYRDSPNHSLHYVTSREMFNIINAIKDGKDPADIEHYRDYLISHPEYDSSPDISGASEELDQLTFSTYPRC